MRYLRVPVLAAAVVALLAVPVAQAGMPPLIVDGTPDSPPICASVYKGPSQSDQANVGASTPSDPTQRLYVRFDAMAPPPDTGHNGTHVSVYAAPDDCL